MVLKMIAKNPFPAANILAQGELYLCGLCRSEHDSVLKAVACLRECAKNNADHNDAVPIIYSAGHFICPLCQRRHPGQLLAVMCLSDCSNAFIVRVNRVLDSYGLGPLNAAKTLTPRTAAPAAGETLDTLPAGKSFGGTSRRPLTIAKLPLKHHQALKGAASGSVRGKTEGNTAEKTPPQATTGFVAPQLTMPKRPPQEPSTLDPDDDPPSSSNHATRKKKPGEVKFTRSGAKYQCYHCKKIHFTKNEAVSCYDEHP